MPPPAKALPGSLSIWSASHLEPAACASASAARQKGAAHIKTAHVLHF